MRCASERIVQFSSIPIRLEPFALVIPVRGSYFYQRGSVDDIQNLQLPAWKDQVMQSFQLLFVVLVR